MREEVDLVAVKENLGHLNINMTLRYAHLSPVHKRKAVEVLGSSMDTMWTHKDSEENNSENSDIENPLNNLKIIVNYF